MWKNWNLKKLKLEKFEIWNLKLEKIEIRKIQYWNWSDGENWEMRNENWKIEIWKWSDREHWNSS